MRFVQWRGEMLTVKTVECWPIDRPIGHTYVVLFRLLRLAVTSADPDRCRRGGRGAERAGLSSGPSSSHFARQLHYVLNFRAAGRRLHWDSAAGCFPSGTRSPWQREEFIFNVSTGRDDGVSPGVVDPRRGGDGAGSGEARSRAGPPGISTAWRQCGRGPSRVGRQGGIGRAEAERWIVSDCV